MLDTTKTFLCFTTHSAVRWPQAKLQNKVNYSIYGYIRAEEQNQEQSPCRRTAALPTGLGMGFDGLSIPLTCDLGFSDFIRTGLLHQDLDQSASWSLEPYSPHWNKCESQELPTKTLQTDKGMKLCPQTRGWRLCPLHFRCRTMQLEHLQSDKW